MSHESDFHPADEACATLRKNESPRVLIIEDNPDNCLIVEQMLGVANYRHISHDNIVDGWGALQGGDVNVVLTDLHVDARTLIERMRADPLTAAIPVIIATGAGNRDDALRAAMNAGANSLITKPFSMQELLDAVEQCLKVKEA